VFLNLEARSLITSLQVSGDSGSSIAMARAVTVVVTKDSSMSAMIAQLKTLALIGMHGICKIYRVLCVVLMCCALAPCACLFEK
jgi:hypothetical protein